MEAEAENEYRIIQESYRVWKIISPKGNLYYVWRCNDRMICSCPAFSMKGCCKHIDLVKKLMTKED